MKTLKKVYIQVFLYLMLLLSGGISALALILANEANDFIYSKAFFDTAVDSISGAYSYIETREYYWKIHMISAIIFVVFVFILFAYYIKPIVANKIKNSQKRKSKPSSSTPFTVNASTEAPTIASVKRYCSQCGTEITTNNKFCPSCGTPTEDDFA